MVFDTHTHAWGPPTRDHPWINGRIVERASGFSTDIVYTADKLLVDMDSAGVDDAIVVGYPTTDWRDNWYVITAVAEHDRLGGIGLIDPFADNGDEMVRELLSNEAMLGFRLGLIYPKDKMWEQFDYDTNWLLDAIEHEVFWEAAIDMDAVVQLSALPSQLGQVVKLVETYPELRYVIDHFLKVDAGDDPAESFSEVEPLVEYDTVFMKISQIETVSNEPYPYVDAHDHVRWVLDRFGRDRLIWGSDFPNVSHPETGGSTYVETRTWLEAVPFLSNADRQSLVDKTARSVFGF